MRKIFVAAALVVASAPALADGNLAPHRIGQCVRTEIASVGERLVDGATGKPIPGSGSAVSFANGGHQVSFDQVPAVDTSRVGDRVRMCLVSIPKNCPPGDDRGRVYRTANLRTHKSWVLPDSEHQCGGA